MMGCCTGEDLESDGATTRLRLRRAGARRPDDDTSAWAAQRDHVLA
jgi:hypothetical protein